ncbi:hypothetical protein [Streptomyces microflavus]|uniref:hypothetical protein n=1 Tax=Streptomyces microflavus TaxID=1919 RepID=UPI003B21AE29
MEGKRASLFGRHAPAYPRSIGFDLLAFGPDQLLAIIGPDKGLPQGRSATCWSTAR